MEVLDTYFSHVCELDLVWCDRSHTHIALPLSPLARLYLSARPLWLTHLRIFSLSLSLFPARHFHKVYMILDEFILAGEIQETSKRVILERMEELEKLEAADRD